MQGINIFLKCRPHKCPDPKAKNSAPTNFAMRVARRSLALAGHDASRLDRKLVYSRFCPVRTFRLSEDDGFFTCCEFLVSSMNVRVGIPQILEQWKKNL
jgi:HIV-1 Vpr-binding protein